MDRPTLRDWVHRFNADGPEGLVNRKAPDAARKLSEEQLAELTKIVEAGPDPWTDGVVRWRCIDLKQVIIVSSRSRFAGVGAVPSGAWISFRPPRRSRRTGTWIVTVSTSGRIPAFIVVSQNLDSGDWHASRG